MRMNEKKISLRRPWHRLHQSFVIHFFFLISFCYSVLFYPLVFFAFVLLRLILLDRNLFIWWWKKKIIKKIWQLLLKTIGEFRKFHGSIRLNLKRLYRKIRNRDSTTKFVLCGRKKINIRTMKIRLINLVLFNYMKFYIPVCKFWSKLRILMPLCLFDCSKKKKKRSKSKCTWLARHLDIHVHAQKKALILSSECEQ